MADAVPTTPTTEDSRERAALVSELFRNHNRTLVRFLESKLQNPQEAREIAQEAYVRLLELERTGAVGFLRAYLFRIASNLAIDRLRSRSTRERIDAHWQDPLDEVVQEGPVEREVFAADEMRVFWASLAELPEHYRVAFVMHRIDNLSTGEIARKFDKSERMVRRYLVHALTYCRLRLQGLTRADAEARMDQELTADG
jgi:RNA polymerase sigma factor (sigma-70 family)